MRKLIATFLCSLFLPLPGFCSGEIQLSGEWNGKARADGLDVGVQFEAKQNGNEIEGQLTVYGAGGVSKHIVAGQIDDSGSITLHDTSVEKVSGRRKFTPLLMEEYELRVKDEGKVLTGTCKISTGKKAISLKLERRILGEATSSGKDDHNKNYYEDTKKAYELGERAKKLVIAEKYAEAEALYREGVTLGENSNAASMHCDLGVVLEMQKKYEEAKAEFEEAIRLDSKYSTAIFNLATCYLNSGDAEEARNRFAKFVSDYPNAVDRPEAQRLLALLNNPSMIDTRTGRLKPNILAAKPAEKFESVPEEPKASPEVSNVYIVDEMDDASDKYAGEHPDYYEAATKKATFRWGREDLPIKVYIESGDNVRGYRYAFREQLIAAFNEWINACQNRLSWKLVPNKEDASIVCSWIGDRSKFQRKQFLQEGETFLTGRPGNDEGIIASATVTICTASPYGLKALKDSDIAQICRHEVGHALGIYGHSSNRKDTMYPRTNGFFPKKELSERDVETINRLYAFYPVSTGSVAENENGSSSIVR